MNDVKITEEPSGVVWLSRPFGLATMLLPDDLAALEAHYRAKFAAEQPTMTLEAVAKAIAVFHSYIESGAYGGSDAAWLDYAEEAEHIVRALAAELPATLDAQAFATDAMTGLAPGAPVDPDIVRELIVGAVEYATSQRQPATPTPSVTDAMVEAAALTTLRRVHCSPLATLDDGPNGDYFRAQARAVLDAALVSPVSEQRVCTCWRLDSENRHRPGCQLYRQPIPAKPTFNRPDLDDLALDEMGKQPTPLDPEPVHPYGRDCSAKCRAEFEQDRARYEQGGD